ncbi:MAG TPA: carboxypeptidase-like regulatory domain-containing protein [Rhodocyclaceae bacterium]|nr:carboxypeptidase-like regulatory domain-containing protein [Rhodocyclaceae bacterium]
MNPMLGYLGQGVGYALLMLFIGYFSTSPAYTHLEPGQALIRVSFAHPGKLVGECRPLDPVQAARLPPGAMVPMECPRERSNLDIEFDLNGEPIFHKTVKPSGLSRDGAGYVYEVLQVPAGEYTLDLRMRDDVRTEGFDHERQAQVTIEAGRQLLVDFIPERGGFVLIR